MSSARPLRRRLAAMGAAALVLAAPAAAQAADPDFVAANAANCSVVPPHTALTEPQQYLETMRGLLSQSALGKELVEISDRARMPICVGGNGAYHWGVGVPLLSPSAPQLVDLFTLPDMLTTGILDTGANLAAPIRNVEDSLRIGRTAQAIAAVNTGIVLFQLKEAAPQAFQLFGATQPALARLLTEAKPEDVAGQGSPALRKQMFDALFASDDFVNTADIKTLRALVTRLPQHQGALDALPVPAAQVANLGRPWGDFLKDTKLEEARYSDIRSDAVRMAVADYRKLLDKHPSRARKPLLYASAPAAPAPRAF